MFIKLLIKIPKLVFFLFLQIADRNISLFFDNILHILNGYRCGFLRMIFFRFLLCLFKLAYLIPIKGSFFIILVICCLLLMCFSSVNLVFNCVWINIL